MTGPIEEIERAVDNELERIVVSGGRVLCVTALGDSIKMAQQRAYDVVKAQGAGGHDFLYDDVRNQAAPLINKVTSQAEAAARRKAEGAEVAARAVGLPTVFGAEISLTAQGRVVRDEAATQHQVATGRVPGSQPDPESEPEPESP